MMAGEEVRTDSAPSTNMQQEQNVLFTRSTNVAAIQTDMEDLRVHTSDHPGMVLVADPLRQIASISQGNMDVVSYYTKLRMLWDELECIEPTPDYDCSSKRTLANKLASNQLMQFIMGLNDLFDAIRNQILVMDPLPVVDKAYSLVFRVESQRQGQMHIEEANTNAALLAKNMDVTREVKQFQKKKTFVDKKNQFCVHCNKSGHSRNACFKLHGYPEWFKEYSEQRKKNIGETKALLAKCENNRVQKPRIANTESISNMLTEVLQLMKGNNP
ncbi:UNVERIFIED_CONTAM: hypothetical protein Sangu_2034300 [Sesamum angustifolium]|uniref:Retrotransposon gag domain-containing protein n=1 Tax=Sesamum angustifolium TaxID=2727405 RepID=A0AAW2LIC3_9LAMI